MKLEGRTILVTGGASGIGRTLVERFAARGSKVIVCGRREERLRELADTVPGVAWRVCDVADAAERVALRDWAVAEFPALDALVNNAGIQRRVDLQVDEDWSETSAEIAINFEAPVHLTRLFLPHLAARPQAAILNVTSGLAFAPLASVPVYSATKAAFHSFTTSLRLQLRATNVEVVEIVPPAVDTDLGGPGLHTFGVNADEFADAVFAGLESGLQEIAYGTALGASRAGRDELDAIAERLASMKW